MNTHKHYAAIGIALALIAGLFALKYFGGDAFLQNYASSGAHFLPVLLVSAVVDSVNPCAFSVLLLTIAFLFSLERTRKSVLQTGAAYIFGVFAVYVLIGLGVLQALTLFGAPRFLGRFGAGLIIIFGVLELLDHYYPDFPIRLKLPEGAHRPLAKWMAKASIPSALVLGALVGLFEFPCTGGPYLLVLSLLHDAGTAFQGFWYLVLYNIIFVLPLAILLLIASDPLLVAKAQAWRKDETGTMRVWGGLVMILLGLLIFAL
jgi:cytochrome c-type biogenesis protein